MEASPFHHRHHDGHHPSFSDQSLSFPNSTATGFSDAIEVMSGHNNIIQQASIIDNKLQSSDSSISMAVHDHHHKVERTNMPTTNSSSFNYLQSNETKTCRRWRKIKRSNNDQENSKKKMRDFKEEGQIGYIHVRARRGEATDSHSLAERVRREKISEKMKALQAIVPGCDKITGKALMLDTVINYVQSLQNEVEVLSSTLASVSPMSLHEFGADFDAFMLKPHQNMITNQQQMPSFQEHQMTSMVYQNNGEILWNLDEQRQELDDPFAIFNTFDSFY